MKERLVEDEPAMKERWWLLIYSQVLNPSINPPLCFAAGPFKVGGTFGKGNLGILFYSTGLWICIDILQIRIQLFFLNEDPDPNTALNLCKKSQKRLLKSKKTSWSKST